MILSTSTNLYCERPDGSVLPLTRTIPALAGAGFAVLDMSFYEYAYPGASTSWFLSDHWEEAVDEIAQAAADAGVCFVQSHAYTYPFLQDRYLQDPEARKAQETLVRRSFVCCRKLGAKVLVVHPDMNAGAADPIADAAEKNREVLGQYLELADSMGMKLALENMFSYPGKPRELFLSRPEEIRDYVLSFHDDRLGVCWDFEHGEILGISGTEAVAALGNTLYATHVSDTVTRDFEPYMHVLPFTAAGQDWEGIAEALGRIGYQGCFSFEAHNFLKKLPDALIPEGLRYAQAVGSYLVQCAALQAGGTDV